MAQTAVSVKGVANIMDVVSFTDDEGNKTVYIVDDVFPARDHNGNINYLLVAENGRQKRTDLLALRWVFGS